MGQQAYSFLSKLVILFFTSFVLQASAGSLNCTFDDGFCDWTFDYDDDFDWQRVKGLYIGSAPESDHTTGYGYFIYIDATYQRDGDKARITSPVQTPGAHCLTLWYNINNGLSALNIYVKTVNGRETLIFTKDTSIGSLSWQKAVISRKTNVEFQVVVEGVIGESFVSDIAVDDIFITDGMCTVDCNFEFGMCHWVQDLSDDFDWKWHQGGTSTPNTGPPGDHRSKYGYYIYIDTSEARSNTNARIFSPWLREGKYCFSLWYYMYGEYVDSITVRKVEVNKLKSELIEITGEHQQQWIQENTFIHATSGFQVIIEGTLKDSLGNYTYGHIAIDDVQMLSCQDCADPTPEYGKTNSSNFTYNSIVQIMCNSGYTIKGHHIIVCKPERIWSGSPTCDPVDCADPTPEYGKTNSSNFTYNSIVQITCNSGYTIKGDHIIACKPEGIWSGNPTCEPVDCADPTPEYGKTNSSNFTYNSIVQITCNSGYTIKGDHIIVCKPEGIWSGSPTCDPVETTNTTALTVMYVTVPLAAVALVIALIAIIWRKRIFRYCAIRSSHGNAQKEKPQRKTVFTNTAYSENVYEIPSNQAGDLSHDHEYAVIANDKH